MERIFNRLATVCAWWVGTSWAFSLAVLMLLVWALFGPSMNYSDTWELIINTSTTIVTFLMVFLIQNSQNRDSRALHLKLDELIYRMSAADNKMISIEKLSLSELEKIAKHYEEISQKTQESP